MKRKLLFAAALLVGALGFNANAQDDVTDKYLVNPSFEILKAADGTTDVIAKTNLESGLYGWEVPSMSNYNVESEASGSQSGFLSRDGGPITPSDGTYYYFNRQGWGNKDSELKTTTKAAVEAGKYYLVFDYKAADYSNNNNAGPNGTTIGVSVKDANDNTLGTTNAVRRSFSLANNGTNPQNNPYMQTAPWTQLGVYFEVEETSVLTFAVQQYMKNSGRSDIIYDNFRLYKIDNAKEVDMTGLIVNPSFEAGNINGWASTQGGDQTGAKLNSNATYTMSNVDGLYVFNTWVSGGTSYRLVQGFSELSGLPVGKYKLSAVVASGPDNAGSEQYTIVLSAGGESTDIKVDNKAVGVEGTVEFSYVGGNMDIVVSSSKWFKADNFRLTYLGELSDEEISSLDKNDIGVGIYYIYNEKTGKFMSRGSWYGTRAVLDDYGLPVQVSVFNAKYRELQLLDNKLYYGDDEWMYTDCDETRRRGYLIKKEGQDGFYTITNTTNNMKVYVNMVDGTNDYGVAGNAILEGTEEVINCKDVEYTYWKFLSAEEYAEIQEAKAAAITAQVADAAGVDNVDNYAPLGTSGTLTFVKDASKWKNTNPDPRNNRPGSLGQDTYGTEIYEGTRQFTQSVENLEEGLYLVSVQGFYRGGTGADVWAAHEQGYSFVLSYLDANGATVRLADWAEDANGSNNDPSNVTQAKALFDAGKYVKSVVAYVGEDGKLDLTIMSPSYISSGWLILNNVTYTKMEELTVTVGDAGYATYVAPVDVKFGDDVEAYIVNGFSLDKTYVTTEQVNAVPAGTPVVVKAAPDTYTLTVADETDDVETNQLKVAGKDGVSTEGIYVLADVKDYGVGFYAIAETIKTLPEGKVYLEAPATIKFIGFDFNDDATGIKGVETATEAENAVIYNLAGQRVANPTKGIYIVNGKKVLVK